MKTVLIVGTSFHTLRDYILDHGHEYVILRDIHLTKFPDKKFKRRVVCDFSSEASILEALQEVTKKHHIDAVIATYENYIVPAAFITEQLKVPGIPVASAKACTDKHTMRGLFAKAPQKISPDFAEVHTEADVLAFARSHQYPLILKPANLAKSLLVSKVHNETELLKVYQDTLSKIDAIYKRYAPNNTPKLLIEEFMEGSIHSVDAFVDSDGTPHVLQEVVDYQTGYDIGYDDNFHYSRLLPSALPEATIEQIRETAAIGCQALGMKNSPAHVEIILTKDGPRIVEIGARNGGYRERMHGVANGIDITGNALKLAFGEQPVIEPSRNDPCAVLELFPKKPGVFTGIAHEDELRALASLDYFSIKATPGSHVGKSSDGHKMTAVIMLHNSDPVQFNRDLEFVNENVFVQTTT